MLCCVGILLLSVACFSLAEGVSVPPSITKQGPHELMVKPSTKIILECEATGYPPPTYEWEKNGREFDSFSKIEQGTITIEYANVDHAGIYQCIASNYYGKALSVTTKVTVAYLGHFIPHEPRNYQKKAGESLTLTCDRVPCVPEPKIRWVTAPANTRDNTKDVRDVPRDKRVTISENGDLHFAYLKRTDEKRGIVYKCMTFNRELFFAKGGGDNVITVRDGIDSVRNRRAEYMFSTATPKVLLLNSNDTIECFFKGKPAPTVSWTRVDASLPPSSRLKYKEFNTQLRIIEVKWEDEGMYECTGTNSEGSATHRIQIDVQSKPEFRADKSPVDRNVTEGDTATFHCDVLAEPEASVQWLINGVPLNRESPGHRRHISEDGHTLVVRDTCKECVGGESDLMVIQCNASNIHGYAFGAGYLNVLRKTVIQTGPVDRDYEEDSDEIAFNCEATTDDSTALTIRWYHNETLIYPNHEPRMTVNASHSLLINVTGLKEDEAMKFTGTYKCNASNGYSHDVAEAQLSAAVACITEPPELHPSMDNAGFDWWLIVVVVITVLLLFLIILISCCICHQRGQGDSYPVDEKERAHGHDPEKELLAFGYHDYSRPVATERVKGSRASLASTAKMGSEDGVSIGESMSSYGDFDPGRFNEDGSFIGTYATDKRKK